MGIEKLTILGKSDATITMILDNLESNNLYPKIEIINNLNLPIIHKLDNPKFNIIITEILGDYNFLFLGAFRSPIKKKIIDKFLVNNENFINIFHKSTQISTTSKIGIGVMINSLVSIAAHTHIGNFVSINRNASIGHHTTIGDFVTINPGANIAGNVIVGDNTLIGIGANVIDGVKIGKNSVIGAGSLITKDVPDNVVVYGTPAKIIRNNI